MKGTPIPGIHYLLINLQTESFVSKIVLNWEKAYSKRWKIEVSILFLKTLLVHKCLFLLLSLLLLCYIGKLR